jgi:hypothetical protein
LDRHEPNRVTGSEGAWGSTQEYEFVTASAAPRSDARANACRECFESILLISGQTGETVAPRGGESDPTRQPIECDRIWTDQPSHSAPYEPQSGFELKCTVLALAEAEPEEGVVVCRGSHMRHTESVATNPDGAIDAIELDRARRRRESTTESAQQITGPVHWLRAYARLSG